MAISVLKETAPARITEEIERFCEEISPGQAPIFVSVMPQEGAMVKHCHINVDEHVTANGGAPVYGWIIWQSSAILDAEFHCNWLSPTGEDVSMCSETAFTEDQFELIRDADGLEEAVLTNAVGQGR